MKGGVLLVVRVKPGSRSWLEALLQNLTVPGQLEAKNYNLTIITFMVLYLHQKC